MKEEILQEEEYHISSEAVNSDEVNTVLNYSNTFAVFDRSGNILPHGKMDFFLCEDLSLLVRNEKGILEPEANPARLFPYTTHISLDSAENCMILVPGLAFDAKLGRIGYGSGYYDRYLSGFCKKMTIGMAFKEQIVEEVPMGQDDILMDLVVTPERAYF